MGGVVSGIVNAVSGVAETVGGAIGGIAKVAAPVMQIAGAATGQPWLSAAGSVVGGLAGRPSSQEGGWGGVVNSLAQGLGGAVGPALSYQGANNASEAANNAAQLQYQSSLNALQLQKDIYDQSRTDQERYRTVGVSALNDLNALSLPGGQLVRPFAMSDYQQDPGYQFRLDQGMNALERSAAARGNLLSGGTLKGLTNYAQGMASQEYGNAANRYNENQSNYYNRLAALAGIGQQAANQGNALGANYASNASEAMYGGANARAAGIVGGANAQNQGISNALSQYYNQPQTQYQPQQQYQPAVNYTQNQAAWAPPADNYTNNQASWY